MKCPNCGCEVLSDQVFCPKCGQKLNTLSWREKQEVWYTIFKWLPEIFAILSAVGTLIYAIILATNTSLTYSAFLDFIIYFTCGAIITAITYVINKIIFSAIYISIEYQRQIEENTRK